MFAQIHLQSNLQTLHNRKDVYVSPELFAISITSTDCTIRLQISEKFRHNLTDYIVDSTHLFIHDFFPLLVQAIERTDPKLVLFCTALHNAGRLKEF